MSKVVLVMLIYHRHKPIDLIYIAMSNFCPTVVLQNLRQTLLVRMGEHLYIHRSRSYFTTDGQSVSMSCCRAHSGACNQILLPVGMLLSESCGLLSVGQPLWREGGSAIWSYCWISFFRPVPSVITHRSKRLLNHHHHHQIEFSHTLLSSSATEHGIREFPSILSHNP
jgi:hypothetical protein